MKKSNAARKTDALEGVYILNGVKGQPCKDLIVEIIKDDGKYCVVASTDNRVADPVEILVPRANLKAVLPDADEVVESKAKSKGIKSSAKDQMVTLRMSPDEVALVDKIASEAESSVGLEVTRSWVIRELLKIGAETLRKRFRG
jgi:hypothetical protein